MRYQSRPQFVEAHEIDWVSAPDGRNERSIRLTNGDSRGIGPLLCHQIPPVPGDYWTRAERTGQIEVIRRQEFDMRFVEAP